MIPPVPIPTVPPVPVVNIEDTAPVTEVVQTQEDTMVRAAKDFISAKYIHESPAKPIELAIGMRKSYMKYGALEFTVYHKDNTPFAEQELASKAFLLCFEKTDEGWEVIADLTGSGTPSEENLLKIKNALPEDFPLDLLPTAWIDLFEALEQKKSTAAPAAEQEDKALPTPGSV